jgi:hypothetical protein
MSNDLAQPFVEALGQTLNLELSLPPSGELASLNHTSVKSDRLLAAHGIVECTTERVCLPNDTNRS